MLPCRCSRGGGARRSVGLQAFPVALPSSVGSSSEPLLWAGLTYPCSREPRPACPTRDRRCWWSFTGSGCGPERASPRRRQDASQTHWCGRCVDLGVLPSTALWLFRNLSDSWVLCSRGVIGWGFIVSFCTQTQAPSQWTWFRWPTSMEGGCLRGHLTPGLFQRGRHEGPRSPGVGRVTTSIYLRKHCGGRKMCVATSPGGALNSHHATWLQPDIGSSFLTAAKPSV